MARGRGRGIKNFLEMQSESWTAEHHLVSAVIIAGVYDASKIVGKPREELTAAEVADLDWCDPENIYNQEGRPWSMFWCLEQIGMDVEIASRILIELMGGNVVRRNRYKRVMLNG